MPNYLFDIRLNASIRLDAKTPEQARAMIKDALECCDVNAGSWPDGSPILFEASLDHEDTSDEDAMALIEVDGEDPEAALAPTDAAQARGDNPLRRAIDQKRKAEGCPDGVPLWTFRAIKRDAAEAALRQALEAINHISERGDMPGAREAWNTVSALIDELPPRRDSKEGFGTEGAEERWIADTEAGVYDEDMPDDPPIDPSVMAALVLVLEHADLTEGARGQLLKAMLAPPAAETTPQSMIEALHTVVRHVPLTSSLRSELLVEIAVQRRKAAALEGLLR